MILLDLLCLAFIINPTAVVGAALMPPFIAGCISGEKQKAKEKQRQIEHDKYVEAKLAELTGKG